MKFSNIPKLTRLSKYKINVPFIDLPYTIKRYSDDRIAALDMNPPFQRGHVWTTEQQIAYVEFKLRGGAGSNEILFNCPGWMDTFEGPFVLVDGKQRINAVLKFLNNEIRIFKYYYSEYEDLLRSDIDFIFHINNLPDMKSVLQWYLEINSGGTPHTEKELDKVKNMIKTYQKDKL